MPHSPYTTGRIREHRVVLLLLGGSGKVNAARVLGNLGFRRSYPGIQLGLVVGICGGVPQAKGEKIFLRDVVISEGIVQYDYGKQYPDRYEGKDDVGIFGMNFFVFDTEARKIVIAHDFWIFVLAWLGLSFLTGLIFLYTWWKKGRDGKKKAEALATAIEDGAGKRAGTEVTLDTLLTIFISSNAIPSVFS
ncbi:uncharacterized protein B0H64DRAFT_436912 [Chaetomium fimeti]|uniref:Nucleoside phosphorylase domain-containing protein n=1 Tax=Chaetomium fimeti TaxID=1854472 RepID=A0AAE0H564_9PEZI|nr:hypothetical protein B0H64DRAFT_436912 [Chaetomium fimeti]